LYKTADRTIFFAVITLTTAAARRKFSELVNRVWYTKERATLTRYGQPLVAVVPVEDLEILDGNSKRRLGRKAKPFKRAARIASKK
jgi:prevent-host-death family protein